VQTVPNLPDNLVNKGRTLENLNEHGKTQHTLNNTRRAAMAHIHDFTGDKLHKNSS
jgi:hypothetical protein